MRSESELCFIFILLNIFYLFIFRYWGSDEEDNKEENTFKANSLEKPGTLNKKQSIPVIDVDIDDYRVPNRKQKFNYNLETKNKSSKIHRQKTDSSDSDIEMVNSSLNSYSLENANSKHFLNGTSESFELKNKTVKKQKYKDANLGKKSKEILSEDTDLTNSDVNHNYSVENAKSNKDNQLEIINFDTKINSKKEKKRKLKLKEEEIDNCTQDIPKHIDNEIDTNKGKKRKQGFRYFNIEETDDNSVSEDSQLDSKADRKSNDKITENLLHETVGVNNKLKNNKKSKIKSKEIEESDIREDNLKSQEIENIGEAFPTIGQVYQQKNERVRHSLPQWLSNPTYISVNLQEKEIPISELSYLDLNTKKNLIKAGINFLFPVQLAVIPWLMQSKEQSLLIRPSDICVSAPTGSGKTLAFVLPIVQSLKDRVVCAVRALVVLPVSELAIQVYKVFQTYTQGTDLKVALLIGKKSFIDEQNFLVKSTGGSMQSMVDIVVATPGRIYDHIYRTQGFCLKRLRYLVIDEADRMMEDIQQGWLKQIEEAVFHECASPNCVCSSYKRTFFELTCAYNFGFISQPLQKLLYSATLTHDPEQLHTLSLYKPKLFTASSIYLNKESKGSCAIPPGIKMFQVICEEGIKPMVICHLTKLHNFKRVLCFTETVERAHRLHLVLEEMGLFKVREISSFNKPTQRKIVLDQFRSGKINILVCSDLVARGIDIQDIDCVISYDIPENDKIYTHRVGRTARAGKTGIAMTLLSEGEIPRFKRMLKANSEIKLPEKIYIHFEDLKPLVKPFQAALPIADAKLK